VVTTTRPYAAAARRYWEAGWPNPIPVRGKWPPPSGYTGYDGRNVSYPDMQAWIDGEEGSFNIALRLPADVVGIDIDAYDGKAGGLSMARAVAELGLPPYTYRSTSRDPSDASGIYLYRVPAALDLRGAEKRFRERFGDHVDIIRRDHRYAVVGDSLHPVTGETYRWYDPDGNPCDIPSPTVLPELPQTWVDFLVRPADQAKQAESHGERRNDAGGSSPWDLPRRFTREQAVEFIRPLFEALRTAPTGTINNRLNDAAVTLSHFVPKFWAKDEATRWLLDALRSTEYDGRTWRAEATIESGLNAPGWRAELIEKIETVNPPERPVRRGDFTGVRNRKRVEPAFFKRADGHGLLYPGKDSYLYAETESGKTWLTVHGVTQCINDNVPVMVVDFEEGDELEYGNRLLDLGMTEEKINDPSRFRYLMVEGRCTEDIMAEADDMGALIVIYEGMSVAYDTYGLQVKENDSATAFRRVLVKPHLVAGRAVLTTDHVVKDRESRGRYAIGGVMKLNAASGGAFLLKNVEGLAPGKRGASNLFVTKDRPGGVKRHGVPAGEKFDPQVRRVGTLVVDDSRAFVSYLDVSILAPAAVPEPEESVDTGLTEKVLDAIRRIRGAGRDPSMYAIRAEVGGRHADVIDEIERLLTAGVVRESRGKRNARVIDLFPRSENEES